MSDDNVKAPSQIFKWFEKMKANYDKNILAIIQRFEQSNHQQQERIDVIHQSHINALRENHLAQTSQYLAQIEQQKQDINYFKQQMAQQQQTILQLNNRYDAIFHELMPNRQTTAPFKDVFDDSHLVLNESTRAKASILTDSMTENRDNHEEVQHNKTENNEIYLAALSFRGKNDYQQAFDTFKKAALLGHAQAMGALGRAYFLSEGVEENQTMGLAWLINAAKLELPQAIKRVEHFKTTDVALYQNALLICEALTKESLVAAETKIV